MKISLLLPVFTVIGAFSIQAQTQPSNTPHPSGKSQIDNRENADVDPATKVLPSTGRETAAQDKALNPSGKTGADSGKMSDDSGSMKSTSSASSSSVATVSESDVAFLKKAAQGGMAEVELSKLAATNASRQEVKAFANMMVSDHTGANTKVMALAQAKDVKLPSELDKMHQAKLEQLKDKKGAEFDAEYVKAMVADHKMTVALFEKQAESGDDAEIKGLAKNILPTLKTHLQAVQDL